MIIVAQRLHSICIMQISMEMSKEINFNIYGKCKKLWCCQSLIFKLVYFVFSVFLANELHLKYEHENGQKESVTITEQKTKVGRPVAQVVERVPHV